MCHIFMYMCLNIHIVFWFSFLPLLWSTFFVVIVVCYSLKKINSDEECLFNEEKTQNKKSVSSNNNNHLKAQTVKEKKEKKRGKSISAFSLHEARCLCLYLFLLFYTLNLTFLQIYYEYKIMYYRICRRRSTDSFLAAFCWSFCLEVLWVYFHDGYK